MKRTANWTSTAVVSTIIVPSIVLGIFRQYIFLIGFLGFFYLAVLLATQKGYKYLAILCVGYAILFGVFIGTNKMSMMDLSISSTNTEVELDFDISQVGTIYTVTVSDVTPELVDSIDDNELPKDNDGGAEYQIQIFDIDDNSLYTSDKIKIDDGSFTAVLYFQDKDLKNADFYGKIYLWYGSSETYENFQWNAEEGEGGRGLPEDVEDEDQSPGAGYEWKGYPNFFEWIVHPDQVHEFIAFVTVLLAFIFFALSFVIGTDLLETLAKISGSFFIAGIVIMLAAPATFTAGIEWADWFPPVSQYVALIFALLEWFTAFGIPTLICMGLIMAISYTDKYGLRSVVSERINDAAGKLGAGIKNVVTKKAQNPPERKASGSSLAFMVRSGSSGSSSRTMRERISRGAKRIGKILKFR